MRRYGIQSPLRMGTGACTPLGFETTVGFHLEEGEQVSEKEGLIGDAGCG